MESFFKKILQPTHLKRFLFFFLFDIVIIIFSLYLSFLLRFDFALSYEYKSLIVRAFPLFIIIKLIAFALFRLYRITWRYVGINELFNVGNALVAAESVLMILILIPLPVSLPFLSELHSAGFPRSIFLIDGIISIFFIAGLRISKRLFLEVILKKRYRGDGKKAIIIGAGNTGEMIIRDIVKQEYSEFYPVALLDDDTRKIGTYLHGVKVSGTTDKLKDTITKYEAKAVIIAIPFLNHKALRNIYRSAKDSKVDTVKIVPRIYDYHKPEINLKGLEDIKIEDLIGRQTVKTDNQAIEDFLKDKVILITGAGGSIGSEIAMQVCGFEPQKVVLFDIDETELYNMEFKLKKIFPLLFEEKKLSFVVGDIRDGDRVNHVFEIFKPQIVFHAAAYKHVPMMEYNPQEAVKVNMFGTYNLAKASVVSRAQKVIMISTDKAVRPTSIMGATKRMAEYICRAFNGQRLDSGSKTSDNYGATEFISVRFGNVLGSRGSVLPLFLEQLRHGGPLTITHKDMQRYFMTIPEAVSLVLQASVIGNGGDVLVLDMGKPVRIVELAEELIRVHGLEPYRDVDLEFVGMRPGEKLFEEILTAEEGTTASMHEKVFIARNSVKYTIADIENLMKEFEMHLNQMPLQEEQKISDLLKKYIKHYSGAKN